MQAKSKSFKERISSHSNPTAIKLLEIMESKKTNLCVAVDVTTKKELLDLAETLGPLICVLKVEPLSGLSFESRSSLLSQLCTVASALVNLAFPMHLII